MLMMRRAKWSVNRFSRMLMKPARTMSSMPASSRQWMRAVVKASRLPQFLRVMTAVEMKQFAEPYIRNKAVSHLNSGKVVIFGCGIGSPFFSTDTAAVLRAAEIGADVVLMAKNIDGVYTADPKVDPAAVKLQYINYDDILQNHLKALDSTATSFSMDNNIPILVFGLDDPDNIVRAVMGEKIGTVIGGKTE